MSRGGWTRFAVVVVLVLMLLGLAAVVSLAQQEQEEKHHHDHDHEHHDHDHEHHDHDHDHELHVEDEPQEPVFQGPSDVLVLTDETIAGALSQHPLLLVEFYAPWCGHCKALAPEWEKAATELQKQEKPFALAKIDCTTQVVTAETYQIQGYPTIRFFRDGQFAGEYRGPRTSDAIVAFAEKQLQPPSIALNTPDEAHSFVEQLGTGVTVIGFFDKAETGTPEFDEFIKTAQRLRNDAFSFAHAVDQSIRDKFLIRSVPALILFKDDDQPDLFYPSDSQHFDSASLVDWLQRYRFPLLDEIGPNNFQLYLRSGLPMGVLFFNFSTEPEAQTAIKDVVRTVAKDFRGKVLFVFADSLRYERQAKRLGLSGSKFPALTIDTLQDNKHFAFPEDQELTAPNLNSWLTLYIAGQLSPTIRSQPVPEANDADPLKIVVGSTYQQVVMDESKDVFIEFYAPWCGHCKHLAPVWEQLAQRLKSVSTVLICKLDATENDLPEEVQIQGYPTLLFFPAKDKANPIMFEQERTFENLLAFVKTHASFPFEIPEDTTTIPEAIPSQAPDVDAQQQVPTEIPHPNEEEKQQPPEDKPQHDEL